MCMCYILSSRCYDWCDIKTVLTTLCDALNTAKRYESVLTPCRKWDVWYEICVLSVWQGNKETFESYYRKQRRKQERLALQSPVNMVSELQSMSQLCYMLIIVGAATVGAVEAKCTLCLKKITLCHSYCSLTCPHKWRSGTFLETQCIFHHSSSSSFYSLKKSWQTQLMTNI